MKLFKKIALLFFDLIDKYFHQRKILSSLKKLKKKIDIYVDVGSHFGLYADLINNNFNPEKIFLFEPQNKIFKKIKKKYELKTKFEVDNFAVSDENIIKSLHINKHDLTSSFTEFNKNNRYLYYKSKLFGGNLSQMIINTEKVQAVRLDSYMSKKEINIIDLLKIDTEGHELQVLKGLGEKISNVDIILIEFHNDNIYLNYESAKIHNYLEKNAFELTEKIKFPFTEWEDRIYVNSLKGLKTN